MRSIEELKAIYTELDAMPLDEKLARLADACIHTGKGLPAVCLSGHHVDCNACISKTKRARQARCVHA